MPLGYGENILPASNGQRTFRMDILVPFQGFATPKGFSSSHFKTPGRKAPPKGMAEEWCDLDPLIEMNDKTTVLSYHLEQLVGI